jgi:site-specific recombinase XerD
VLNSLTSASGQRTYDHAIREFVAWYCSEPRLAFNRTVVLRYRIHLEQRHYAPATINLRLAAVRRVAYEAADAGLLSPELAAGIRRVKGVRRLGVRLGNWLTPEQGRRLLTRRTPTTPRELRDHAMLACSSGVGSGGASCWPCNTGGFSNARSTGSSPTSSVRVGTSAPSPCPRGSRTPSTHGPRWPASPKVRCSGPSARWAASGENGMTAKVLWDVVRNAAAAAGINNLAPHDLRRTCARLCHLAGGELDQIQFLLGHVSIQTTERYLGCTQKRRCAVNDRLGIEPDAA